ncbi:MAG TPA: OmpH family outer membrane protein [Bryobacteraceae bacterium]|jgi:outer membrane protein
MLRFSNRLLSLSALALVLGTGAAQAQKFAIINMQQAVLLTTEGKKASAEINAKFTPVKTEIDGMVKNIQAKQDAFTKNRATLTPAAASSAQAEIQDLTTKLQRRQQDAQQDLQEEENKQLGNIVPKLQQIINQYAAANGVSFVIDTSANPNNLVFGDASLNIIAPVVTAYEKANGGVVPPAGTAPAGAAAPAAGTTPRTTAPAPRTTAPKAPGAGK